MGLSAVAGIIDVHGGLRVVVTDATFEAHLQRAEKLYVVPDLRVQEPVPFEQWAWLIGTVERHIEQATATIGCGSCSACCKTLYIDHPRLKKSSHQWCHHICATGCGIYERRPKPCKVFQCLWLKSQRANERMHQELRPDRCGVIFTKDTTANDPLLIEAHVDRFRPEAIDAPVVQEFIAEQTRFGMNFKRITHYYGEKQ